MLKKIRWRFIGAAMFAVFAITLILVLTINLMTSFAISVRQDQMLSSILDFEINTRKADAPLHFSGKGWFGSPSPEAPYSSRFFTVRCDLQGNVLSVSRDNIASVSESDASEFAREILVKNQDTGYIDDYRYAVGRSDKEICLVFLNSANELQLARYVLLISCAVALTTFMLIFILVILLSGRAIRPYAQNLDMQRQFITDAGHELKTPLTSISTSADVLAAEQEDNEWVKNIQKQSARMSRLVNNLVSLSRLDEVTPFPEKCSFSLSEAAWETAEPFSSLAKAGGKIFTQDIQDGLTLVGDKNAIQQMISILLDNAIKYSLPGGQIHFDVSQKRKKMVIEVSNTCENICAEDIDHLFDRFYRPDRSRSTNTGGTGIGLSIAKATAEGHGGRIAAKCPSEGSILFTVTI